MISEFDAGLAAWLRRQARQAEQLTAELAREHEALLTRDAEGLLSISRDKAELIAGMTTAAAELPRRIQVEPEANAIGDWFTQVATDEERLAWEDFTTSLEICRTANKANGALAAARVSQIASSLRYLREAAGPMTYGAQGRTAQRSERSSLARA